MRRRGRPGNTRSMTKQTWPRIDRSPLLLRDGYRFAQRRRTTPGEDATRTRLAGSRAVVVRGPRAVEFFYMDPVLERSSAIPQPVMHPLFGPGAVHGLDGPAHASRKSWFNDVLDTAEENGGMLPFADLVAMIASDALSVEELDNDDDNA